MHLLQDRALQYLDSYEILNISISDDSDNIPELPKVSEIHKLMRSILIFNVTKFCLLCLRGIISQAYIYTKKKIDSNLGKVESKG